MSRVKVVSPLNNSLKVSQSGFHGSSFKVLLSVIFGGFSGSLLESLMIQAGNSFSIPGIAKKSLGEHRLALGRKTCFNSKLIRHLIFQLS